jgi:hypothetical protein
MKITEREAETRSEKGKIISFTDEPKKKEKKTNNKKTKA